MKKRGWCPTLSRPMETGDGWLVRIAVPGYALDASLARTLADLADAHGNGLLDLTRYGNLQFRGVSAQTYPALRDALRALGLLEPLRETEPPVPPGILLGLPFSRMDTKMLRALAALAPAAFLTHRRAVIVPRETDLQAAQAAGFIVTENHPLRYIYACPGAPACAQALGDTRTLAFAIAEALPDLAHTVHVSGCGKGCAWPKEADAAITAQAHGYALAFDARAGAGEPHTASEIPGLIRERLHA